MWAQVIPDPIPKSLEWNAVKAVCWPAQLERSGRSTLDLLSPPPPPSREREGTRG